MMEQLLQTLVEQYHEIRKISDWSALQKLTRMDEINRLLDSRAALLNGVEETARKIRENMEPANPAHQGPFRRAQQLAAEARENDRALMGQIRNRMEAIRLELQNRSVLKHKAIPGYMKQMGAFA